MVEEAIKFLNEKIREKDKRWEQLKKRVCKRFRLYKGKKVNNYNEGHLYAFVLISQWIEELEKT